MARIGREFDEMWADASDEMKEVFSREQLDNILHDTEAEGSSSCATLTPVIAAMAEALTSGDPELRYIVHGSNRLLDNCCVRWSLFLIFLL